MRNVYKILFLLINVNKINPTGSSGWDAVMQLSRWIYTWVQKFTSPKDQITEM